MLELKVSLLQCRAVAQDVLGGLVCALLIVRMLKQSVYRGVDVFYGGAVLGFQHGEEMKEERLMGHVVPCLLQCCQCRPCLDAGFEDGPGFDLLLRWWQQGHVVVGLCRVPGHERAFGMVNQGMGVLHIHGMCRLFPMFCTCYRFIGLGTMGSQAFT